MFGNTKRTEFEYINFTNLCLAADNGWLVDI